MLVSIIIPYFNDQKNIFYSVKSVLNQSYQNYEIIIIDDENSKDSNEILKEIKELSKKILITQNKKNYGVAKSRNIGLSLAKGQLIAFLDSDDLWKKNKLSKQVKEFIKFNVDISYTNYVGINDENKILYKVKTKKSLNFLDLLKECPICCSSVILKKKILESNKFQNLRTKEDYLLWLTLAKKNYIFKRLDQFMTIYRVRNNSLSSKYFNKLFSAYAIYNKYLKYNFFLSSILIIRLYYHAFKKKYL